MLGLGVISGSTRLTLEQVLDLIKAAPEAALQKLRRCVYFRLAA
jgi:hypothetical protein